MAEQEDEEEKLKWRVDAEVKLAVKEFQAAESQQGAGSQGQNCATPCSSAAGRVTILV